MAATSPTGEVMDGIDSFVAAGTAVDANQPIMTPNDVEELFQSSKQRQSNTIPSAESEDDDEVLLSDKELQRRVESLGQVLSTLQRLLGSESADLDAVAKQIGDGSRDGM